VACTSTNPTINVRLQTDGEVSNTLDIIHLIRNQAGSTRVFTFGVGADASKDLVIGMSREGRGRAGMLVAPYRAPVKLSIRH